MSLLYTPQLLQAIAQNLDPVTQLISAGAAGVVGVVAIMLFREGRADRKVYVDQIASMALGMQQMQKDYVATLTRMEESIRGLQKSQEAIQVSQTRIVETLADLQREIENGKSSRRNQ